MLTIHVHHVNYLNNYFKIGVRKMSLSRTSVHVDCGSARVSCQQVLCCKEGSSSARSLVMQKAKTVQAPPPLRPTTTKRTFITGSGNDQTYRIVLDLLGIDPKPDPEPLRFKSVGEGSRALNQSSLS
ncbi:glycosyltransferase family 2 protein [Amanita muscaria Koide BX008]|uniref:Glycosyltransferase family 2 protein n=1 Tax=Amanita muscaria (strain Koide BX008) TaxID=946122 RepID=A0A0C2WZ99_AMAMK|nr:glycosyltransferase family 2 protein [Amanita muscaria Koide BX008]